MKLITCLRHLFVIITIMMASAVNASETKSKHYQCVVINNEIFKKHYVGFEAATAKNLILIYRFDKKEYVETLFKFECELTELNTQKLKPFTKNRYFKTGLYINAPIKIEDHRIDLKAGILYLSYAPMSLARDARFEGRLANCDFDHQNKIVGLNLLKYGKHPYCLLMEKGHQSYIGIDKIDHAKVELNCWDQVKSCSMLFDYRNFKLEINDIPKAQIKSWQQIKQQIIQHFDDHLVMHYQASKQCEGDFCNEFMK